MSIFIYNMYHIMQQVVYKIMSFKWGNLMSLSHAILGLLNYGPMTGYNLKKIFDKSISQVWAASLSQIYRELSALEKKGYVSSSIQKQEDKPDKKIYKITQQGKNVFLQWLSDFPENLSFPKRDEFMLRIFFGSRLEKEELIKQFRRFISQKKEYLETLTEIEQNLPEIEQNFKKYADNFKLESAEKEGLFWHFTIKRAIMSIKVLIKWAEECIEELEDPETFKV